MPILDTPITTDDNGLKKVLGQKQPAVLILFDDTANDKPLADAAKTAAKKHAGDLLVVRVNGSENPRTMAQYDNPDLPALVTLTPAFFGRKIKSSAEGVRPSDLRSHIDHLLRDKPLPEKKSSNGGKKKQAAGTLHLSDKSFPREVLKSSTPVLVDFWAPWCGPCRSIAPFIDQMATKYAGQVKIAKVNTDQHPRISQQYDIRSIPTMILFKDGKPAERIVGANPRAIQNLLDDVSHGH